MGVIYRAKMSAVTSSFQRHLSRRDWTTGTLRFGVKSAKLHKEACNDAKRDLNLGLDI